MQGKAIGMYDLSGMMSVCLKTGDQSRINVLSALVSMGMAIKAAQTSDVGVISPYIFRALCREIWVVYPVQRNRSAQV